MEGSTQNRHANVYTGCTDCQRLQYDFDIIIVDEQNHPIVHMPYTLTVSNMQRKGVTDEQGRLIETDLKQGPAVLVFDSDKLAESLLETSRTLRVNRDPLESPVRYEAFSLYRDYRYVRIGELIDRLPTISGWQSDKPLPDYHFPEKSPKGLVFFPHPRTGVRYRGKQHIYQVTLEVCPLRVWVLLLEYVREYRLNNAYNLALMSTLAYANEYNDSDGSHLGSVDYFFHHALRDVSQHPRKINQTFLPCLVQDVPLVQGYSDWGMFDSKQAPYRSGDTQFFYVYSATQALIAWRGTESMQDALTDVQALQVISMVKDQQGQYQGKMHAGFRKAYHINKKFQDDLKEIENTIKDKQVFICGHSLGGALAQINGVDWCRCQPILYTYGMPRVFDKKALSVQERFDFSHFRHVNDRDPVPSVPMQGLTNKNRFNILSCLMPNSGAFTLIDRVASKSLGCDPYYHHGQLVYFLPAVGAERVVIKGKRAGISVNKPFSIKLQLLVDEQLCSPNGYFDTLYRELTLYNDNPKRNATGVNDHYMQNYSTYLYYRVRSQLSQGTEWDQENNYHFQIKQFHDKVEKQLQQNHEVKTNHLAKLVVEADQLATTKISAKALHDSVYQRFFLAIEQLSIFQLQNG